MDPSVIWALAGIALIIIELATGTLYLLFLGFAALGGALVAYAGGNVTMQVLVAAALAMGSLVWARSHKRTRSQPVMAPLDTGQPVVFEEWVDRGARRARVRYRGTLWEAVIAGEAPGEKGETFYIVSIDANTLTIAKTR